MENNLNSSDFIINDVYPSKQYQFANLKEIYSSPSGHNRIFCGERHGKLHALKALKDSYANQPFYQQVLLKEFNIGYQLEHPHICHTLGWEQVVDAGQCIVLEFIDGITLKEIIEKKKLNNELAIKIITELCEALQYLHKKQIVHRDLKPSNILITHNGNNVKLIDFGLSDCDDYDILKLPAGTRYYLAPEILDPNTPLDSRSDIYSLGIIIGEIATILNNKKLATISRKCTQHSPTKRYASTSEIINQINNQPKSVWFSLKTFLSICIFFILGGIGYYLTNKEKQHFDYPIFGETCILNKDCQKILLEEKAKYKTTHNKEDSLRIITLLKETLDTRYPLPQQKTSQSYQRQWKVIQQEVSRLTNGY